VSAAVPPPLPAAPVIELREASKWYGDVIGVNQVTLGVRPGVTGLLGPNGAGKSTLMKLVTGQLKPGSGSVAVLGVSPWRSRALFRRVAFCPDTESFYEDMTGTEFVELMGRLSDFGAAESRRRAADRLELVGMGPHASRRIKGYSKGMRQRTKLAAALVHDPEVIILDEPLNGLDPLGRLEMLGLFRDLGSQGRTVVVSSHILHEIESLTQEIALIHRGRILAEGRIEEIRALIENQPLTLQVTSPAPRAVGAHLAGLGCVVSVQYEDDGHDLIVRTKAPESVYEALQSAVLEGRYAVQALAALDDNLDAVFQYLVRD
jgi:ABC-2 type transport system ATP-binding protein